jgi:hypothetical protein
MSNKLKVAPTSGYSHIGIERSVDYDRFQYNLGGYPLPILEHSKSLFPCFFDSLSAEQESRDTNVQLEQILAQLLKYPGGITYERGWMVEIVDVS